MHCARATFMTLTFDDEQRKRIVRTVLHQLHSNDREEAHRKLYTHLSTLTASSSLQANTAKDRDIRQRVFLCKPLQTGKSSQTPPKSSFFSHQLINHRPISSTLYHHALHPPQILS
jgi:hypothetical protein